MGMMGFLTSDCGCNGNGAPSLLRADGSSALPIPNPAQFAVVSVCEGKDFLAAEIRYPNCTNYEGLKLMVFECTKDELLAVKRLDPHFCEGPHLSPIARFEPTGRGQALAAQVVAMLDEEKAKRESALDSSGSASLDT